MKNSYTCLRNRVQFTFNNLWNSILKLAVKHNIILWLEIVESIRQVVEYGAVEIYIMLLYIIMLKFRKYLPPPHHPE